MPAATSRPVVIFLDFESVHDLRAASRLDNVFVYFFRGAKQKTIDDATLDAIAALPPGSFQRVTIAGTANNALDFHIAFYLGETLNRDPSARCVVVSKDGDYDLLIQHLRGRGFDVSRHRSVAAVMPVAAAPAKPVNGKEIAKPAKAPPTVEDVITFLGTRPAPNRPRKRAGLVRVVETHYKGRVSADTVEALVQGVFDAGKLSEIDGKLVFHC